MYSILCSKKEHSFLANLSLVFIGSVVLAIASQLSIPLTPVPITLQSATVLFIGMVCGWRLGLGIILLYLLEGLCGLPVFANFSFGLSVLLGPTGGYLFGFILAVLLSGYLMQRGCAKHIITAFLASIIGTIPIFMFGPLMLANFIGWHNAYLYGIQPFYLIEAIKLIVLAVITPMFWRQNAA